MKRDLHSIRSLHARPLEPDRYAPFSLTQFGRVLFSFHDEHLELVGAEFGDERGARVPHSGVHRPAVLRMHSAWSCRSRSSVQNFRRSTFMHRHAPRSAGRMTVIQGHPCLYKPATTPFVPDTISNHFQAHPHRHQQCSPRLLSSLLPSSSVARSPTTGLVRLDYRFRRSTMLTRCQRTPTTRMARLLSVDRPCRTTPTSSSCPPTASMQRVAARRSRRPVRTNLPLETTPPLYISELHH